MAADPENLVRISSYVMAMLKAPTWVSPIANFIDENCLIFDDAEENKLEYTLVHKAFTQLVDELLTAHLLELSVTTEEFMAFCQHGLAGENELHRSLVEQLVSVDDFLVFKAMMVKRSADLRRETLVGDGAETEEEKARQEAEQLEIMRLEAERLDVERRCLEAELQLMVALSMQLEQRLQLTMALNELVEAVSKMEAMAAEAAEEPGAAEAAAAAPATMPAPAPALPPTVRVQPLRDESAAPPAAPAPAAPMPAPAPATPVVSGPSEAERQARAEHLKRQREALVAKKKKEREAELSAFQQTQGPTLAARAAERACARAGPVGMQQPPPDSEAGKRLVEELSGGAAPAAPALPDPEAAAVQMRKTIARQLKQSLTQPSVS